MIDLQRVKTVIFDFGGVIIDLHREKSVAKLEEFGVKDADSLLSRTHHDGIFMELERGKVSVFDFRNSIRARYNAELSDEKIDEAWISFLGTVAENKLEFIKSLRRKYRVLMLSNTNVIHFDWCRKNIFGKFGYGLDDLFDELYLSYEMKMAKPDKEIYQELLRRENIEASECLFIDDSKDNILAAQELGIQTYLYNIGDDFREIIKAGQ